MSRKILYQARFLGQKGTESYHTKHYSTKEEAQDELMKMCGDFGYLGTVTLDEEENLYPPWKFLGDKCQSGDRNGGTVSVHKITLGVWEGV